MYSSATLGDNHYTKHIDNNIGVTNYGTGTDNINYSTDTANNIFYSAARNYNLAKPTAGNDDIEYSNPRLVTLSVRLSYFIDPTTGGGQSVSNYHSKRPSG